MTRPPNNGLQVSILMWCAVQAYIALWVYSYLRLWYSDIPEEVALIQRLFAFEITWQNLVYGIVALVSHVFVVYFAHKKLNFGSVLFWTIMLLPWIAGP